MSDLGRAVQLLAGMCDGAVRLDGCGFNRLDTAFGHSLAIQPEAGWSINQRWAAWNMLRKYREQLKRHGIEYEAIPRPADPTTRREPRATPTPATPVERPRVIHLAPEGGFLVRFGYLPDLNAELGKIPGTRWKQPHKAYLVPATQEGAEGLQAFVSKHSFTWGDGAAEAAHRILEGHTANVEASKAARIDGDFEIDGLGRELYPFQKAGVAYILRNYGIDIPSETHQNSLLGKNNQGGHNAKGSLSPHQPETASTATESPRIGSFTSGQTEGNGKSTQDSDRSSVVASGRGSNKSPDEGSCYSPSPSQSRSEGAEGTRDQLPRGKRSGTNSDRQTSNVTTDSAGIHPRVSDQDEGARNEASRAAILQGGLRGSPAENRGRTGQPDAPKTADSRTRPEKKRGPRLPRLEGGTNLPPVGGVFLCDAPGLGKTLQALAAVHALSAYPALVICPASVKLNWVRETILCLPGRSVTWLTGKSDAGADFLMHSEGRAYRILPNQLRSSDLVIVNYDLLTRWLPHLTAHPWRALICDEFHLVKNAKAQRTTAVKTLALGSKQEQRSPVPVRLLLSGTPVPNRPNELISPLQIINRLHDLGGWSFFTRHYCEAFKDRFGWNMTGGAHLEELNHKMRGAFYVRRLKSEVLPELPEKTWQIVPTDIDNRKEYERAEADVIAWLSMQAAHEEAFLATVADFPADQRQQAIKAHALSAGVRAARAEQLVRIGVLKKLAARGKLEACKEWIADFLETGEKLVVYAAHKEIQQAILDAHPGAVRIFGEDSALQRDAAVQAFQQKDSVRVMVASLQAGREGITLTAASNVVFLEQGWNPATHRQAEDRLHRIGQRDAVTCTYLLARDTIDEDIRELIEEKRAVVDTLTEGDPALQPEHGILGELVERLLRKKGGSA